jgi:hypothetical protein
VLICALISTIIQSIIIPLQVRKLKLSELLVPYLRLKIQSIEVVKFKFKEPDPASVHNYHQETKLKQI